MQLIVSESHSPSFNLAAEQYLLAEHQSDVLLLYINSPCIIVGRNQNAFAEVNIPFCRQKNISVVRRLSGGGTVYHDEGNINFCFISQKSSNPLDVDHLAHIEEALAHIGIDTSRGTRKDLYFNHKKISGTAMHSSGDHLLFHGTLLYNTNLDWLEKALTPIEKVESRAVKSIRSEVGNMHLTPTLSEGEGKIGQNFNEKQSVIHPGGYSPLLRRGVGGEAFTFFDQLLSFFSAKYRTTPKFLSPEEKVFIAQLQAERYDIWEWNWAQSPKSQLTHHFQLNGETYSVILSIEKGIVTAVSDSCPTSLQTQLIGKRFEG